MQIKAGQDRLEIASAKALDLDRVIAQLRGLQTELDKESEAYMAVYKVDLKTGKRVDPLRHLQRWNDGMSLLKR